MPSRGSPGRRTRLPGFHGADEPVGPWRQGRRPGDGPAAAVTCGVMETSCGASAAAGRKLLVPYVTGGLLHGWQDAVRAAAASGADAIEIGLPFSDPVMDGPDHPHAPRSRRSYAGATPGAHPRRGASRSRRRDPAGGDAYYNTVHHAGLHPLRPSTACRGDHTAASCPTSARRVGPVVPGRRCGGHRDRDARGTDRVPTNRLPAHPARAAGFLYSVGLLGVTGERTAARDDGHVAGGPVEGRSPMCRSGRRRRVQHRAGSRGGAGRRWRGQGASVVRRLLGRRPRCGRRVRRRGSRCIDAWTSRDGARVRASCATRLG